MRTLIRGALAGVLAASLAASVGAQVSGPRDSVKVRLIRDLLAQTHAVDQAMATIETTIPAQRAANPRIPAVFWERFLAQARARRNEFEALMVAVYDRHFSSDEIRELLAFYRTPIGQKILASLPAVMQESLLAGQQWGQTIGASVGAQLEAEGVRIKP